MCIEHVFARAPVLGGCASLQKKQKRFKIIKGTRRGEKKAREAGDGGEEGGRDNRVMRCYGPAGVARRTREDDAPTRSVVAVPSACTDFLDRDSVS